MLFNILLLLVKDYLTVMESTRGAPTSAGSGIISATLCAATSPANPTQQLRRGAGSRLTYLTGTFAGCARTTPRCQGPLGPAVTRDSGPTGTGSPATRGTTGAALAVTPASVVALAATPALVAALAETPAATKGSGGGFRPHQSINNSSRCIIIPAIIVIRKKLNVKKKNFSNLIST